MSTNRAKIIKRYGADPMVPLYLTGKFPVVKGIYWYASEYKSFILLPYIDDGNKFIWTEDKLFFAEKQQMLNFCKNLNSSLQKANDRD